MATVATIIGLSITGLVVAFILIIWSANRTANKKRQEKLAHKDKEYQIKEMEIKVKQLEIESKTQVQPQTQPQVRHFTCKYCGYATPEDMAKCQHCGAAL